MVALPPAAREDRDDMTAILETRDLTKTFGALTAANGLTVSVEGDTVVGLIGGNGAGKTTFVNLVTGYLKPTRGTVLFAGKDITGVPPRRISGAESRLMLSCMASWTALMSQRY